MNWRIRLTYEDGTIGLTPAEGRWLIEWQLACLVSSGFYNGRRVISARIIKGDC